MEASRTPGGLNDAVLTLPVLDPCDHGLVQGVLARQPRALAKTITLLESTRRDHQNRAAAVLHELIPHSGRSIRVGISGSPGAGKSTFIEALGLHVLAQGHRIAVLAVDPSSLISGGSILGDKTRMERLSQQHDVFIRPSPSRGSLGGVAEKTRESILVCEASGFDVILVETVGVGQSEMTVAGMVDVFVLLQLPNAGDDLQAIKRGIVELADLIVITKADLDPKAAERARHQFAGALGMLRGLSPHWRPPVIAVSAISGDGIPEFWNQIRHYREVMTDAGEFQVKRRRQAVNWMWMLIDAALRDRFRNHPDVRQHLDSVVELVGTGRITPATAAHRLLRLMDFHKRDPFREDSSMRPV
jgi:LAO/AO transport system kinase